MVRGVIRTYTSLQPCVVGKSELEVTEALGDRNLVKTSPIVTTICVCLLLGVPEVHTKLKLIGLIFFFLNIFVKVLKWYICQFDEISIVNTKQLVIHQ